MAPQDLANAGFIFTGRDDSVQCAFCATIVDGWEEGDIPMDEHKKVSENCVFVQGKHINMIVPQFCGGKKAKCWYLQCDADFKERKSLMIHVKRHHQTIGKNYASKMLHKFTLITGLFFYSCIFVRH